jgi:anaerobic selenocysteine-containing dehydrogenase
MHPYDLDELGLSPGDVVDISSRAGRIIGIVEADDDLRRGIVSMAFGFGDGPEHDEDFREIGSSTTRLVVDDTDYDRYTGQPRMSNIPVAVVPRHDASRG